LSDSSKQSLGIASVAEEPSGLSRPGRFANQAVS